MHEKRFCLQCDDGTLLEYDMRDLTITLEGLSVIVHALSGWHCPNCGDCEFDDGEGKRYSEALETLRKTVDKQHATKLRTIRKKLRLKQTEAGRLFCGGTNAFSEYENGKTQPHKSTVLLLRLLDKYPELLKELVA